LTYPGPWLPDLYPLICKWICYQRL
jgi:hypothetical protein